MKTSACVSICAIFLFAGALSAQNNGSSANGTFQFSSADRTLTIEFDAREHGSGQTKGQVTLSGSVEVPDQDVDGEGGGAPAEVVAVSLKIEVDCLQLAKKNPEDTDYVRAAMSGEITESSVPGLVGRRGILAVEDNGEGSKAPEPDRFMWGLYRTRTLNWVATDAELEFDPGAGLTWLATDAERTDDAGIPSHPSETVDCKTFPVSSYTFENLAHGNGNIQVKK